MTVSPAVCARDFLDIAVCASMITFVRRKASVFVSAKCTLEMPNWIFTWR